MKREGRHPIWNWVIHTPWVLATLAILAVIIFFGSGAGNPLIQRYLVRRIQAATGGKVEIGSLSIRWLTLEATLHHVVIHGREPVSTEALFAADELRIDARVDSFWGRKISLDELYVKHPQVHVRVSADGTTNIPLPQQPSSGGKFNMATVVDMRVRRIQIENGWVLYNDVATPLDVEGGDMHLMLVSGGNQQRPVYLGTFEWKAFQFTTKRFFPIPMSVSAKFTIARDGFTIEQAVVSADRSHLDAQVEMSDYVNPKWHFRYRGWLNLLDLRETLRSQETPTGRADFRGEATLADGKFLGTGSYTGENIELSYQPIFHAAGLSSRGNLRIDNKGIEVSDFVAFAFGGTVKGHISILFDGLRFRAVTHVEDAHL
jgi:hypothetical protein